MNDVETVHKLAHAHKGASVHIATILGDGLVLVGKSLIAIERMVPARVASKPAATHERTHRAVVARHLLVKNANTLSTFQEIRRGQQLLHQALRLGAHLLDVVHGGQLLLGQNVATHATDEVQPVGFTGTGEHFS